jgi:hypothetical protein
VNPLDVPVTRDRPTTTGGRVLALQGLYTSSDAHVVSRMSLDLIRTGCRDLELDLRDAVMESAALILLLLRPAHWMSRRAGRLRVRVIADDAIEELLRTLAIHELVEVEAVERGPGPTSWRSAAIAGGRGLDRRRNERTGSEHARPIAAAPRSVQRPKYRSGKGAHARGAARACVNPAQAVARHTRAVRRPVGSRVVDELLVWSKGDGLYLVAVAAPDDPSRPLLSANRKALEEAVNEANRRRREIACLLRPPTLARGPSYG